MCFVSCISSFVLPVWTPRQIANVFSLCVHYWRMIMRNFTNHRVTLVVKRSITALPCIRQVLIGRYFEYTSWGFVGPLLPVECRKSTPLTAVFNILSKTLFLNSPRNGRCTLWVAERVIKYTEVHGYNCSYTDLHGFNREVRINLTSEQVRVFSDVELVLLQHSVREFSCGHWGELRRLFCEAKSLSGYLFGTAQWLLRRTVFGRVE